MTTTYKLLGQNVPTGNNRNTTLYSVPNGKQTVVRSINITNSDPSYDASYSIAITEGGAGTYTTGFVALNTDSGTYMVSTDAVKWLETSNSYVYWNDVNNYNATIFDKVNNIYVHLPQGGTSAFNASTDGVNWRSYSLPYDISPYFKMVYRPSSNSYFLFSQYYVVEIQFDINEIGTNVLNYQPWSFMYDYAYPDTLSDSVGLHHFDVVYSSTANLFVFINNYYDNYGYGVMTSTDGFTWQQTGIALDTLPGYYGTGSIEIVHDYIVIASNAFTDFWVAYSKDGIIWNQMWWPYDGDFIDFHNIAFNNNKMVLQSNESYYQSTDITPQTFSLFIAPSGVDIYDNVLGYLFSTDGINWENGNISDVFEGTILVRNDYIVASNNKIVLFGDQSNAAYVTEDGTTWKNAFIDQNYALQYPSTTYNYDTGEMAIYYYDNNNEWYAFQTSTNGINWTTVATELNYLSDEPQAIAYGNNGDYAGYLGVDNDGGAHWSTDGITWEAISTMDAEENYYTVKAIAYDAQSGIWIAHDGDSHIFTISNPYDWTNIYTLPYTTAMTKILIAPNQTWSIVCDFNNIVWTYDGDGAWYENYLSMYPNWYYAADYNPQNNTWAMTAPDFTIYSTDGYTWEFSNVNSTQNHWTNFPNQGLSMSHATFTNKRPMWNFNDDEFRSYTSNSTASNGMDLVYGNGIWLWEDYYQSNSYSTDLITWTYAGAPGQWWDQAQPGNILYEPINDEDYIASYATIKAGETITIKSGYTLDSNNNIIVTSDNNNVGFMAFGAEIE
jgi:hypothetical protein